MDFAGLLGNNLFRLISFSLPALFIVIRGIRTRLDWLVFAFVVFTIGSEVFTLMFKGYNLVYYSIFVLVQSALLTLIVYNDVRFKWLLIFGTLPLISFTFFYLGVYSFLDFLHFDYIDTKVYPINQHQFFDLCSIANLVNVCVVFIWLHWFVNSNEPGQTKKRLIYIFAFLAFYAGTYFTIAFGRLALPNFDSWYLLWSAIFFPIYFLFMLVLFVGLLWK